MKNLYKVCLVLVSVLLLSGCIDVIVENDGELAFAGAVNIDQNSYSIEYGRRVFYNPDLGDVNETRLYVLGSNRAGNVPNLQYRDTNWDAGYVDMHFYKRNSPGVFVHFTDTNLVEIDIPPNCSTVKARVFEGSYKKEDLTIVVFTNGFDFRVSCTNRAGRTLTRDISVFHHGVETTVVYDL